MSRHYRVRKPKPRPAVLPTITLVSVMRSVEPCDARDSSNRLDLRFRNRRAWRNRLGAVQCDLAVTLGSSRSAVRHLTPGQLRDMPCRDAARLNNQVDYLVALLAVEPKSSV